MNGPQIHETPNTGNEQLWSIKQAVAHLRDANGNPPPLTRGDLSKLGRDCSMVARIWKRPTGSVPVVGESWTSEKSYTSDVLLEVFRIHPATKAYVSAKESTL